MQVSFVDRSQRLEGLAYRLYQLSDETARPSRSQERCERLIHEAESIALSLRAEFRGGN